MTGICCSVRGCKRKFRVCKTCPYHCPGGMKKVLTDQGQKHHTGMPFHIFYRITRKILSLTAPEAVQNIIKDLDNQQASDDIMKELVEIMAKDSNVSVNIVPYPGENTAAAIGEYLRFRTQVLSGSLSLSPAVCAFRV
jgi:hypothetical protein